MSKKTITLKAKKNNLPSKIKKDKKKKEVDLSVKESKIESKNIISDRKKSKKSEKKDIKKEKKVQKNPYSILYLESNELAIRKLKDLIIYKDIENENNLHFFFAKDLKEAMKILDKEKIDLIITEIVLSYVNGYHLIDYLKNKKLKIPVVIYTNLKDPQDLAKMAETGVDNILLKALLPIEDLIQMIITKQTAKKTLDNVLIELNSQVKVLSKGEIKGKAKIISCTKCGMIVPAGVHFCPNCGQKIFNKTKKNVLLAIEPENASGVEMDENTTKQIENYNTNKPENNTIHQENITIDTEDKNNI